MITILVSISICAFFWVVRKKCVKLLIVGNVQYTDKTGGLTLWQDTAKYLYRMDRDNFSAVYDLRANVPSHPAD
ncbi:hypothetical protein, partial [Cloacibacillus sp.]|uniref:hypothetical protein n=1 Tax=Cloacibacillus sp. TaxID=2049023 RepID=UPI0025C5AA3E